MSHGHLAGALMALAAAVAGWWGEAHGQGVPPPAAPFVFDGGVHFVMEGLSRMGPGGVLIGSMEENAAAVDIIVLTRAGEVLEEMGASLAPGDLEQFVGTSGDIVLVRAPRIAGEPPGLLLLSLPADPGAIPRRAVVVGVCESDAKTVLRLETQERLFLTVTNPGRCRLRAYLRARNTAGETKVLVNEFVQPGGAVTIDLVLPLLNGLATVTSLELQCFDRFADLACEGRIEGSLRPGQAGAVERRTIVSGAAVTGECPSDRQRVFLSDEPGVFVITVKNPPVDPTGAPACPLEMRFTALRFESKSDWDIRVRRTEIPPGGTAQVVFDNRKFGGVVSVDITCGTPGDGCRATVSARVEETPEKVRTVMTSIADEACDGGAGLWFSTNLPGIQSFKVSVEIGSCPVVMSVRRGQHDVVAETVTFPAGLSSVADVPNPNPAWVPPDGKVPDMVDVRFECVPAPPATACSFSVTPVR